MNMRLAMTATVVLMMLACSRPADFDRRVTSADDHYMSDLAGALDAAGIDFRAERDGSIAYRSRDEQAFKAIEERVKQNAAGKARAK